MNIRKSTMLAKGEGTTDTPGSNEANGWVGVVGSQAGLARLSDDKDLWWCLPRTAKPGELVAMYATETASSARQGIFGVFRLVAFDESRDSECRIYGKGRTVFVKLAVIKRLELSIGLKKLRLDPILGAAPCVRQNFQGTSFRLPARELRQVLKLARIEP